MKPFIIRDLAGELTPAVFGFARALGYAGPQAAEPPEETAMRSELVFYAMANVPNRFLLMKLASTATRKFHRPNTRIPETVNDVLVRFAGENPMASAQPVQMPARVPLLRAS